MVVDKQKQYSSKMKYSEALLIIIVLAVSGKISNNFWTFEQL